MENKKKQDIGGKIAYIFAKFSIVLFSVICVIPFLFIVSGSFSSENEIEVNGYSLLPQKFTLDAYKMILSMGDRIPRAYLVTIFVTVSGTLLGLLFTSMSGYVLSRPDFKHRNKFAFFIYFTTLFSGGLIPSYLVNVNTLHLYNNLWVLILPGLLSPFNIFLFRNFVKGIPESLAESARIDGASDFRIYWNIIMPLTKPVIATLALFLSIGYWNNWFSSSIYIKDQNLYMLQYLLYTMLTNMDTVLKDVSLSGNINAVQMPTETMKLATAVLATGPVLLFYPFVQKYFVGGLTVGGVKG